MRDPALVASVLEVLDNSRGYMVPEQTVVTHVNILLPAPRQDQEIRDTLMFCKDQGWAQREVDAYQRNKWWITDSGRIERQKY